MYISYPTPFQLSNYGQVTEWTLANNTLHVTLHILPLPRVLGIDGTLQQPQKPQVEDSRPSHQPGSLNDCEAASPNLQIGLSMGKKYIFIVLSPCIF